MSEMLIDTPCNGWSHLVADTIPSLHTFAQKIGLSRGWFQNKKGKNQPHYDVRGDMFQRAITAGAKLVPRRELFLFLKEHYK